MEESHPLLRPLLHPSTTTDNHLLKLVLKNSGIIFRLSLVVVIGIVSVWANHEASKGFSISIVNESDNTFPGTRFHLFYVSNDEGTRLVIKASQIIENFLYPDSNSPAKKPIKRVVIRLAKQNLTEHVIVESGHEHEFVLNVSPSIMEDPNFGRNMVLAVQQGVARMWLWDGQGRTPKNLINGIVEYLVSYLGGSVVVHRAEPPELATACREPRLVAEFLEYWERRRAGFVRRLNGAMKDGWDDEKLGGALGLSVKNVCRMV